MRHFHSKALHLQLIWYKSCDSSRMKHFVCLVLLAATALPALAHDGQTSSDGCHDNLLGGSFHCHSTNVIVGANVGDSPVSPAAIETRSSVAPQSNFSAKTIEDDQVFAAQVVLQKNGCYDGRLDGVLAPGTVYGLKLFEANMGLQITGLPVGETQAALRASHNRFDICR